MMSNNTDTQIVPFNSAESQLLYVIQTLTEEGYLNSEQKGLVKSFLVHANENEKVCLNAALECYGATKDKTELAHSLISFSQVMPTTTIQKSNTKQIDDEGNTEQPKGV